VRAWFGGEIRDFVADGERSVRFAHPTRPGWLLKIKGAGLMGRGIRFGRRHRANLPAPVFDFEGRVMEDVASGHDNAFLGGASFQQCANEYAMAARLDQLGYPVVPVVGFGSVAWREHTSWFAVMEWPEDAERAALPKLDLDTYVEAKLFYGRQALELATKHGLIGYYWYATPGDGALLLKDLHPFRQADPINMSRLSWVLQVFFTLDVVSLSTVHAVKKALPERVPDDVSVLVFRALLPSVTVADYEALRRDLILPYMRKTPADFDPGRLMAVLEGNPLTAALLDLCPPEFTAYDR
jgi:hypothetical protein